MTKRFNSLRRFVAASLVACSALSFAAASANADDVLTIGSTAPALDIEHWISNGNGQFKPVKKFEDGKVYVVEFWATWCGPCVYAMPHLVKLQKEFADSNVQIISISDEDTDTVKEFLEKEFEADEDAKIEGNPKTFGELTSAYCLTTDPDQSSHKSYMEAAGQNGIPCAFIVGKDQKIEWIGHPMSMDDVLKQVVDGKWDRAAFQEEFKKQQELDLLQVSIGRAFRDGDLAKAIELIDKAIAETKDESFKLQMQFTKFQILLQSEESKDAEVAETLKGLLATVEDSPERVNMITWAIYGAVEDGNIKDKNVIKIAREAAAKAATQAEGESKAAILDTVAHLLHKEGDVAGAIKVQEQAIELAGEELKEELQGFLEELKEELK